jgi:hypothetical protein
MFYSTLLPDSPPKVWHTDHDIPYIKGSGRLPLLDL